MTKPSTKVPENFEAPAESAPIDADPSGSTEIRAYRDAIEEYLDAADWLTALDAPIKVHARSIAQSLDLQLGRTGEIQSALASSFDKALFRLDARRPKPAGGAEHVPGQQGIEWQRLDD